MKSSRIGLGIVVALLCLSAPALADWGKAGYNKGFRFESEDGKNTLRIANRVQVRWTHESPDVGVNHDDYIVREGLVGDLHTRRGGRRSRVKHGSAA